MTNTVAAKQRDWRRRRRAGDARLARPCARLIRNGRERRRNPRPSSLARAFSMRSIGRTRLISKVFCFTFFFRSSFSFASNPKAKIVCSLSRHRALLFLSADCRAPSRASHRGLIDGSACRKRLRARKKQDAVNDVPSTTTIEKAFAVSLRRRRPRLFHRRRRRFGHLFPSFHHLVVHLFLFCPPMVPKGLPGPDAGPPSLRPPLGETIVDLRPRRDHRYEIRS